jgi:hypothetical protein
MVVIQIKFHLMKLLAKLKPMNDLENKKFQIHTAKPNIPSNGPSDLNNLSI